MSQSESPDASGRSWRSTTESVVVELQYAVSSGVSFGCRQGVSFECRLIGPSPRVRGIHSGEQDAVGRAGSIPACAGNPPSGSSGWRWVRVHPRVCGESSRTRHRSRGGVGPSPRVRGIQHPLRPRRPGQGSIPACAGNPRIVPASPPQAGVHPRVCGESGRRRRRRPECMGPSPRVRGIPGPPPPAPSSMGSIPACAGNPHAGERRPGSAGVHPRVCGESMLYRGQLAQV